MRPGAEETVPRQTAFVIPQNLYNIVELGRVNHGYETEPDDLDEYHRYNNMIESSNNSADASGTTDSGTYLDMDKCSRSSSTIPRHLLDFVNSSIKYTKGPDYEEVNLHQFASQSIFDGYTSIEDGSAIVSTVPSNGLPGRMAKADGRQHLILPQNGNFSTARARMNPLYATTTGSLTGDGGQSASTNTCSCRLLQAFCFLFCVAAIAIAVVAVVVGSNRHQSMATNYHELSRKFDELNETLLSVAPCNSSTGSLSNVDDDRQLTQQLIYNNSQLQRTLNALQDKMQSLENVLLGNFTDLINSMTNQIPHGLANFSSCSHNLRTSGTSAYTTLSRSESLNLTNSIVLSVVCTTVGGTESFLEYDPTSPNIYSCVCRGQTDSTVRNRFCIIHYWTCPIIP